MRASLVIVLGGFAATGCAELGWDIRTPKVEHPPKPAVAAPGDNPDALAAPFVTLQDRSASLPVAPTPEPEVAAAQAPPRRTNLPDSNDPDSALKNQGLDPVVVSRVFHERPSPVIPPFEPVSDSAYSVASKTETATPATAPEQPSTPSVASTEPMPTSPEVAMPSQVAPDPSPASKPELLTTDGSIEATVLEAISPPAPTPQPSPSPAPSAFEAWVSGYGQVPRLEGRPVSKVGNDVITLPELTTTVKARIAQFPQGSESSRQQVIELTRTTLVAMVVRSLLVQEAQEVMGGPSQVADAAAQYARRWDLQNGLSSPSNSTDPAREEFVVRSLAIDLMTRQGFAGNLNDYLDELGRRRTITSMMKESELMATGKREAAAVRTSR